MDRARDDGEALLELVAADWRATAAVEEEETESIVVFRSGRKKRRDLGCSVEELCLSVCLPVCLSLDEKRTEE